MQKVVSGSVLGADALQTVDLLKAPLIFRRPYHHDFSEMPVFLILKTGNLLARANRTPDHRILRLRIELNDVILCLFVVKDIR